MKVCKVLHCDVGDIVELINQRFSAKEIAFKALMYLCLKIGKNRLKKA